MKGQSLVEFIIAIALATIMLPALLTGVIASREGKPQQNQRLTATAYLTEAAEALRSIRESGWTNFAQNGTFHPEISGNNWILVTGSEIINGFTRQIVISDVYRNESGAIAQTGGSLDPSTKRAITTVSWNTPFSSSVQSTIYLSRYLNNTAYTETSEADFQAGTTIQDVTITHTAGGEVILGAGGHGNVCSPNLLLASLDLPKQGVANGITAIPGFVFAGTGNNASGESYVKVLISNTNPPVPSIAGTFSNYKTNNVFGETNYGYIATDTNAKEIVIIDISTTPFTEIGFFDSPGSTDANSIFVKDTTGYMTAGDKFYNFDLSSKSGPRPAIDPDGVTLAGTGNKIVIVGNYAYVVIASTTTQLQIVDISNPTNLTIVGQVSVDGLEGRDVYVNESVTRAYLTTATSTSQKEFFIIDITTKTGSHLAIGSYEVNGMNPKAVTVIPGNKAILVGTEAEEFQVIDITNETNPTRCGGISVDTGINGISSVLEADGDTYSYIITGDANSELKIIEGGPGGQLSTSGIFESATFDPGSYVAFNRFDVTFIKLPQTDIKFHFAIADPVEGNCTNANFSFIGPDKTAGSYFTDDSPLPLDDDGAGYENPGRCFRYKVYFTTQEKTQTPVFYDLTVNYSP